MTMEDAHMAEALADLARACRILEMEGHGDFTLGHLSLRAPDGSGYWMKRNAIGIGEVLGPHDFVLVDWNGTQLAGSGGRHSEWPIHSEIYAARPDINVIAHTHPFHACVLSASLDPLLPFTLDADYFTHVPRHEDEVALITTKAEGQALAAALGTANAVLMGHHGATFGGKNVQHATCIGIFLEKACKAHIAGLSAGFRTRMPAEETRAKRHAQIMTDRHIDHTWNYLCRKLGTLGPNPLYS